MPQEGSEGRAERKSESWQLEDEAPGQPFHDFIEFLIDLRHERRTGLASEKVIF